MRASNLFVFLSLFISTTSFAKDDWSHCVAFIEEHNQRNLSMAGIDFGYGAAWEIGKEDGKFVSKAATEKYAYTQDPEAHVRSVRSGPASNIYKQALVTAQLDESGALKELTYKYGRNEMQRYSFDVRNGVCTPKTSTDLSLKPQLMWDSDACRELSSLLAKQPDALNCKCGNDKTDKAIGAILDKYKIPAGKEEAKKPVSFVEKRRELEGNWVGYTLIEEIAGVNVTRAYQQLSRCGVRGLADAVKDKRLAVGQGGGGNDAATVPPANTESGNSAR